MNFSTPLTPVVTEDGDELEADTHKAIEKAICEAQEYIDGKRAQGEIPFKEEGKE